VYIRRHQQYCKSTVVLTYITVVSDLFGKQMRETSNTTVKSF